jgi:tetratricopeptide (TPR) repeat protein
MGFRMRKSFKVAPGLRVNVSKRGAGVSVGGKAGRVSVHSSGRRTVSVGNPVMGPGYVKQYGGGKRRTGTSRSTPRKPPPRTAAPVIPQKPGLFAPKADKALHKALLAADTQAILAAGTQHSSHRAVAHAIAGVLLVSSDPAEAERILADVFDSEEDPGKSQFLPKYGIDPRIEVGIAPGLMADLPVSREGVGLALAELRQGRGDIDGALAVVQALPEGEWTRLSLADLYREAGEHDKVMALTEGIENVDDFSALLLTYRGSAMRHLGFYDGAIEALRAALKSRARAQEVRNLARWERGETYAAQGKKGMARRDFERLLADNGEYPGVRERLSELA